MSFIEIFYKKKLKRTSGQIHYWYINT